MSKALTILFFMVLAAATARAQQFKIDTGNDFLRECSGKTEGSPKTTEEAIITSICSAYVAGFQSGILFSQALSGIKTICLPKQGIEHGQSLRIVVKWMNGHPETLHQSTDGLILQSLVAAFQCQ